MNLEDPRRLGRLAAVLATGGLALAASLSCDAALSSVGAQPQVEAGEAQPCSDCNLVLISLDTLRADHIECFGYERVTMPETCAFFEDGLRFERAYAQAPWTAPAHASIFTGRLPAVHGVVDGPATRPLGSALPTLFSILKERGYATLAVHGGGFVRPALPSEGIDHDRVIPLLRRPSTFNAVRDAVASAADDQPFFLFLHAYDPHTHYKPKQNHFAEPNAELDAQAYGDGFCEYDELPDGSRRLDPARIPSDPTTWDYVETLYDSEIFEADQALGRVYRWLAETGRLANTVVAFTSDHGEEFFEHGSCEHVKTVYDEVLHVPLLVRGRGDDPRLAARVDTRRVPASIGIAPTLLDALGIDPAPHGFDAPSLLDPGVPLAPTLAETRFYYDGAKLRLVSVSDERSKLIRNLGAGEPAPPTDQLFDLVADPGETRALGSDAAASSPLAKAAARYARQMKAGDERHAGEAPGELDCATLEQLRELGYVGPGAERLRCP